MTGQKEHEITPLDKVIANLDENDDLQKQDKEQLISYRDKIRKLDDEIAEIGARIEEERKKREVLLPVLET